MRWDERVQMSAQQHHGVVVAVAAAVACASQHQREREHAAWVQDRVGPAPPFAKVLPVAGESPHLVLNKSKGYDCQTQKTVKCLLLFEPFDAIFKFRSYLHWTSISSFTYIGHLSLLLPTLDIYLSLLLPLFTYIGHLLPTMDIVYLDWTTTYLLITS